MVPRVELRALVKNWPRPVSPVEAWVWNALCTFVSLGIFNAPSTFQLSVAKDRQDISLASLTMGQTGCVIPSAKLAGIIGTVSSGLYATLSPTISTSRWPGH